MGNAELLANYGVGVLPDNPRAHHRFARSYRDGLTRRHRDLGLNSDKDKQAARREALRGLRKLSRLQPTVLLSSEDFSSLTQVEAQQLHDDLVSIFEEVTVAIWLRRQDFLLTSAYSQSIKAGATKPNTRQFVRRSKRELNYSTLLQLADSMGSRPAMVFPYLERAKVEPKAGTHQLLALANVPVATNEFERSWVEPPPGKNASLSTQAAAILRVINPHIPRMTASGAHKLKARRAAIEYVSATYPGSSVRLTQNAVIFIRDRVLPLNNELRGRLTGPVWEEWFAQDLVAAGPLATATPEDVAATMAALGVPRGPIEWDGYVSSGQNGSLGGLSDRARRLRSAARTASIKTFTRTR